MKKTLREVIRRVEFWPEERQENAAKVLLEMEAQATSPHGLTTEQAAEVMPEREQRERSLSTLNKIGQFLADFRLRNILGQPKSGFDIDEIVARKQVFIANLAQGELGIGKSRLLGALLIVSFYTAALRRKDRTPFHIVVDEFQTFGASTFADMLSGIRKFGVSLTLAHQYLEQLGEPLRAAMMGTVGSILAFKVGARDAEILAAEFGNKASDFTLLEPHTALLMSGDRYVDLRMPALTAKRYPAAQRRIVNRVRNELARHRTEVEQDVKRLLSFGGKSSDGPAAVSDHSRRFADPTIKLASGLQ